jgi:hypothetical protein
MGVDAPSTGVPLPDFVIARAVGRGVGVPSPPPTLVVPTYVLAVGVGAPSTRVPLAGFVEPVGQGVGFEAGSVTSGYNTNVASIKIDARRTSG